MKARKYIFRRDLWPEWILLPICIVSIVKMIDAGFAFPLVHLIPKINPQIVQALIVAGIVYAGAHVLRAVRLSLLMGVGKLPFTAILGCHSVVSFITFALPLKLGELIRAVEFYRLTKLDPRVLLAIWLERCSDAVIVLCLIEVASASVVDTSLAHVMRRGLMVLLGFSLILVLFGRSAMSALLRILSSSDSSTSLKLMRFARGVEVFVRQLPPLTSPNLALLFIVSCLIWALELTAVFIVTAGVNGIESMTIDPLIDVIGTSVTGLRNTGGTAALLYQLLVTTTLGLLSLLFVKRYAEARWRARPKSSSTKIYRFNVRDAIPPHEQNVRAR